MTATTKGFRTRAQLGLRAPRSVSRNITPASGGSAVHWGGSPAGIKADHAKCEQVWRSYQDHHMDGNGWVDIAYTGGFCQHGKNLAGRGFGVRTAANGTNAANQSYYAFVWIGGSGETPTVDAINALEWWIDEARKHGGAGPHVPAHKFLVNTKCPGSELVKVAARLNDHPVTPAPVTPHPPVVVKAGRSIAMTKAVQLACHVTADGMWGNRTQVAASAVIRRTLTNVRALQGWVGTKVDGDWGKNSEFARLVAVRRIQSAIGVKPDGDWGPLSARAWATAVANNLNKF